MSPRILLVEDDQCQSLTPVALLRPAFELLCGHQSLRSRVRSACPTGEWGVAVRSWLADGYAEEHPECHVNDEFWIQQGPTIVVNGRWIPDGLLTAEKFEPETVGIAGSEVAWIRLTSREMAELQGDWNSLADLAKNKRVVDTGGVLFRYPWELVRRNPDQLMRDFADAGVSQMPAPGEVQCQGDPTDIYVSERAVIDPYVVIDARNGPVSIGHDVHVLPFTRIEGPCHIASKSQLFRAHVRSGTTVGPVCRVGGEVEESILHSHVTKYHEGFLGHSYVCPWVNFGAMTTTSDLKNNYSNVKVPLEGRPISTGMNKVGTFFGDHTKTAIDSMFNTGSSIGVMCMVLPDGGLLPRHVPSFSSVQSGTLSRNWTLESGLETARVAMARRDCELTEALEEQLRTVFEMTSDERNRAFARAARLQVV